LSSILPPSFEPALEALDRFGYIILIIAVFTGVFGVIFSVIMPIVTYPFTIGLY